MRIRATGMVREARAQARIHHPNVAHIYFIGEDAGRLYFAMEYLSGKTLAERLAAAAAGDQRRARGDPRRACSACARRSTRGSRTATSSRRTS